MEQIASITTGRLIFAASAFLPLLTYIVLFRFVKFEKLVEYSLSVAIVVGIAFLSAWNIGFLN
jgi:hypothetical protein